MNINSIVVAGRLGKDPELKSLPSGSTVTNFTVATSMKYKDKSGNIQESTEWFNCIAFGKTADTVAKFFKKGKEIYLEGRLQTRSWDKDGVKQYRTEVIVSNFQFVGYDKDENIPRETSAPQVQSPEGSPDYPVDEIDPSEIPF